MTALVIVGAALAGAGVKWAVTPVVIAFRAGLVVGRFQQRRRSANQPTREWNT